MSGDRDDDDGNGNGGPPPAPSIAAIGPDAGRPPALRRAIAAARAEAAADLEGDVAAAPSDMLIHGAQATSDAAGLLFAAATKATYAAAATANPGSVAALELAAERLAGAIDEITEVADHTELASNVWQAALDDILAQLAELHAAQEAAAGATQTHKPDLADQFPSAAPAPAAGIRDLPRPATGRYYWGDRDGPFGPQPGIDHPPAAAAPSEPQKPQDGEPHV